MASTAEHALSASFTPQKRERLFEELMRIYDLADNVMSVVQREDNKYRDAQLELTRPFITQTINSTNILSAFYTDIVRGGRPITPELQDTVEGAFRIFFEALDELIAGMEKKFPPNGEKYD